VATLVEQVELGALLQLLQALLYLATIPELLNVAKTVGLVKAVEFSLERAAQPFQFFFRLLEVPLEFVEDFPCCRSLPVRL